MARATRCSRRFNRENDATSSENALRDVPEKTLVLARSLDVMPRTPQRLGVHWAHQALRGVLGVLREFVVQACRDGSAMSSAWYDLGSPISGAAQSSGVLTLADITSLFQSMYDDVARVEPDYFLVSPQTVLRLRIAQLYAARPLPRRKLRKCIVRKRQAVMSRARRRLLRQRYIAHRPGVEGVTVS
jgi:hypothetical protein